MPTTNRNAGNTRSVIVMPSSAGPLWRRNEGAPLTPATSLTKSISSTSTPRSRSIDWIRASASPPRQGGGRVIQSRRPQREDSWSAGPSWSCSPPRRSPRRRAPTPLSTPPRRPPTGSSHASARRAARHARPFSRARRPYALAAGDGRGRLRGGRGVVREMMERGMRALTGEARTLAAWRRFFEPGDVVGIKVNAGGAPVLRVVARDRGRDRPPAARGRPAAGAGRGLRALLNQLAEVDYAPQLPAGVRDPRRRARQPQRRAARLRPAHLRRGAVLRRGGHALEHDAARDRARDQDRQRAEHEGPRRDRGHRLPEEHRLRQLLERRAHARARRDAHAARRWARSRRSSRCARARCCR